MKKPCYLKAGDKIRIISPAGKISPEKINHSIELLQNEGFEVEIGSHVFDSYFQFAGTDQQRFVNLQEAFDDEDCKAVICSRGGYGTVRLISQLDFSKFNKNPKWLVGFSDITVLHAALQKSGFCSIHGAMPSFFLKDNNKSQSYTELINILTGNKNVAVIPHNNNNRTGITIGKLTGGNLSVLYSLLGTPFETDTDHKILFLEDVGEYLYHIDRMMWSLKLAGKLERLAGLVVGGFSEVKDGDFGQSTEEIIMSIVKEYSYPVCFNYPAGHIDENLPLMLGADYLLEIDKTHIVLKRIL